MKINLSYKNIAPDEPLRVFIEEKIGGLEKYIGPPAGKAGSGPIEARVELALPSKHHRSGPVFYAEANLKVGGKLLRATSQNEDMRAAIVEVKDELQKQIKKFKEKKRDISRKP
jgi:ribosomal subunit interface protein